MRTRTTRTLFAAVALAATTSLTACGGGGDDDSDSASDAESYAKSSSDEIRADVRKAMGDLTAVHLKGDFDQDGKALKVDIGIADDGCEGEISVDDGTAEIVSVDGSTYLKGDDAFWEASTGSAEAAQMVSDQVGDKYVDLGASGASFDSFCDIDSLMDSFNSDTNDNELTVEGTEEVDGEDTVKVKGTPDGGGESTAWVLASDPHYVVKLVATGGDTNGEMTLTDFNDVDAPEKPAADEIASLSDVTTP